MAINPNTTTERAEKLLAAANDATRFLRALYVGYVAIAVYIALIAGGITDAQLFLDTGVVVPFLSDLHLESSTFFAVAPPIFFLVHFELLLYFLLLAKKLHSLNLAIRDLPEESIRVDFRTRLADSPFNQWLSPTVSSDSALRALAGLVTAATLFLAPVLLLLLVQARFLPFHSTAITGWHRALITFDVFAVWYFWGEIRNCRIAKTMRGPWIEVSSLILGLAAITLSLFIARLPADYIGDDPSLTRAIFDRPRSWLHRNLFLPDFTAIDGTTDIRETLRGGPDGSTKWLAAILATRGPTLQGRDFRYANLRRAILVKADFSMSNFSHASLDFSDLSGAEMSWTNLTNSNLFGSALIATNFGGPPKSASPGATLVSAFLWDANLTLANLSNANLTAALLTNANLNGANLSSATLIGADLLNAQLIGANLMDAHLNGTDMRQTKLIGTELGGSDLTGADLRGASVGSASFIGAVLRLNDLRRIRPTPLLSTELVDGLVSYLPLVRKDRREEVQILLKRRKSVQTVGLDRASQCLSNDLENCANEDQSEQFFQEMAQYLGEMICGGSIATDFQRRTFGMINMRIFDTLGSELSEPEKTARKGLIKRLLKPDCAGRLGQDPAVRTQLEMIADL
jgi:uncharacterized protein YjbI with pentapeptide repeats